MERAGPTPPTGIRPDDLVSLAGSTGPFATVWTARSVPGDSTGGEGAADRRIRAELAGLEPGAEGAVVIADGSGVRLVEALPEPPRVERAAWAPLPSIVPGLEHRQAQVAAIVVLADRTGADVLVHTGGEERRFEVEGDDQPIRKVRGGGWSHRRMQQRAEDSWEHNAREVAEAVARIAADERPELVVLGGDERAVTLVEGALPGELRSLVRTIGPGRAADGSQAQREREVARLVRTVVAADTVALLRAFAEEDGRGARAANGVAATMEALRRSQVDVLLVHDDGGDDESAFFGAEPGDVGVSRADVLSDGAQQGRLVDVAVRAALRTGAAVRVVPDVAVLDGPLGAILRWSD